MSYKNILLFIFVFLLFNLYFVLVFAIDSNNFRQEYKPTYGSGESFKTFSSDPPARLNPKVDNRVHTQLRNYSQDPQSSPRYNSCCQFGMCLPGGPGQSKNSGN